jgi:signal transduction histidine kinase
VLAASEMLEDTPLDEVQLKLLSKLHRSGDRLQSLVAGILDFSRIEAGELELTTTTFDLHTMVADAADPFGLRALEAGIQFRWDLDPRVPRMLLGDPNRLFQVLTNVLDNALKFTHHGTVRLNVQPCIAGAETDDHRSGTGEGVEFVVEDTGIGIGEADQESVFVSFSQVDGSITRRYGGNGLGLAICRDLVELMGGSITLRSRLGMGSTFVIRIPLTPGLQTAAPSDAVPIPV